MVTNDAGVSYLMGRVLIGDDCWIWTGARNTKGYGQIHVSILPHRKAHRAMFALVKGPIPQGYEIDHLCGIPSCVRPAHLEAVPGAENRARSGNLISHYATRDTCKHGHPFTVENTSLRRAGRRICRTCEREAGRRYAMRKKVTGLW